MGNEGLGYCARCDKYVEPDSGFECPICQSSLRPEKEILTVSPEAVAEPAVETEPEEVEESVEAEEVEVEAEVDEVIDIESLLSKG